MLYPHTLWLLERNKSWFPVSSSPSQGRPIRWQPIPDKQHPAVNLRMMKEDVAFRLEQGISSENALVLNGLATFRVVGKPRVILKWV